MSNQSDIDQDKEPTARQQQTIDSDKELAALRPQRNPIFDYEGIRYEKREQLRRNRAAAKGNVTKKIKELTETRMSTTDISEARAKAEEFYNAMDNFYKVHADYHALIEDEYELQDSEEYLLTETQRIDNFKRTLIDWIHNFSDKTQVPTDREINSSESISNVGSKVRGWRGKSRASVASSQRSKASSAMAAAAAKKATLRVQAEALNKYRALEEEELRLKHEMLMLNQRQDEEKLRLQQRKKELQLETEIAKADAEERAYARTVTNDEDLPLLSDIKPASNQDGIRPDPVEVNIPNTRPDPNSVRKESKKDLDGSDNSEIAEQFLQDMMDVQRQQLTQNEHMFQAYQARDQHMEQLLSQQRQLALSMALPEVEVPTFGGDPINYSQFIRSFETLIEAKTRSNSARLSYLIQYTSGDVQELMRSCLTMNAEDGYHKARSLLKQRYGENYRIATAYVDRIVNPIYTGLFCYQIPRGCADRAHPSEIL